MAADAVWKFPVSVSDEFSVVMPEGAEVLWCAEQDGAPWMWARVDCNSPPVSRTFFVRGTGHEVEPSLRYVGSFMLIAGRFVGHLFEPQP